MLAVLGEYTEHMRLPGRRWKLQSCCPVPPRGFQKSKVGGTQYLAHATPLRWARIHADPNCR